MTDIRQINQFAKIDGEFRSPGLSENNKQLVWDNPAGCFRYESPTILGVVSRETGSDRAEFTLSDGTKLYLDLGALAWLDAAPGAEGGSGYVLKSGDTMVGDLVIEKGAPVLRLYNTNTSLGIFPSIEFDSISQKGISVSYKELDIELPVSGYGLVVGKSPLNTTQTGALSFNVLGEIYAGATSVSGLKKVFHAGNANLGTVDWTFKDGVVYGNIGSPVFTGGFAGEGWRLDGNRLTIDYLTVRKELDVYMLMVNQIRASNGAIWVSDGAKILSVADAGTYWVCTIDTETGYVATPFDTNDVIRCQVWNGTGIKYYSAVVTSVNNNTFTISKTGIIDGLSLPAAGDEVVRVGNVNNPNRRGSLYLTASDTNAPYMAILDGVTGADFAGKQVVQLGKLDNITSTAWGALTGYGIYTSRGYFENVYVSGNISASTGDIGGPNGWLIGGGYLYSPTSGMSPADYPFYAGAAYVDIERAKFSVSTEGYLNSALGLIGGWTIGSTTLSAGQLLLDSTGLIRAYNGAEDLWRLNDDGSGILAKGNISWSASGELILTRPIIQSGSGAQAYLGVMRGAYDPLLTYYAGDEVTHEGSSWIYINAAPTSGNTPTPGVYWTVRAQGGVNGTNGTNARYCVLTSPTFAIAFDTAGNTPTPSSVVFTAEAYNMVGIAYYEFFVNGVSQGAPTTTNSVLVGLSAKTFEDMPVEVYVEVREASATANIVAIDHISIIGLKAGEDSVSFSMSNSSHTVPADEHGVVSAYTGSGTVIRCYDGIVPLTFKSVLTISSFVIGTPVVSPAGNITVGSISGTATTAATVAAHSGMDAATDLLTITFPVTAMKVNGGQVSFDVVQTISKSKQGISGVDGKSIEFIFKRTSSAVAPSAPVSENTDDFVPVGWTDNMTGVDETYKWEWVCQRSRVNDLWGPYTNPPALWAKFGDNGSNGDYVEYQYKMTTSWTTPPDISLVNTMLNPSGWSKTIPVLDPLQYVWKIQAVKNFDGTELVTNWTMVGRETGVPGSDGAPGVAGPAAAYRGTYVSTETYYGNSRRADVVFYNGRYYVARTDAGEFVPSTITPEALPSNTDYWNDIGAYYTSIATGLLIVPGSGYIENLIAPYVNTSRTGTGQRIVISGDDGSLKFYDASNTEIMVLDDGAIRLNIANSGNTLGLNTTSGTLISMNVATGSGIDITNANSVGVGLRITAASGTPVVSTAINSTGTHVFKQRSGDKWTSPGVLVAIDSHPDGSGFMTLDSEWGDGVTFSSITNPSAGVYVYTFDTAWSMHNEYGVYVTPVLAGAESTPNLTAGVYNKTNLGFTVKTGIDSTLYNIRHQVMVVGRTP